MNPVYSRSMIDQVKAEIEAIIIDQNEMKEQIKSLAETVLILEKSLKTLISSLNKKNNKK
jgi:tetrahydromethanopterin S-methyltransferase subunit B